MTDALALPRLTQLASRGALCHAACECPAPAVIHHEREAPPACATQTVAQYLAAVYPTAAMRIQTQYSSAQLVGHFDSLDFYWDPLHMQSHHPGCLGCPSAGAQMRFLYEGLLPCIQPPPAWVRKQNAAAELFCVARHASFGLNSMFASSRWLEVEHRAFGFIPEHALPAHAANGAVSATDMLEAGPAVWLTYRRGSGIFYDMGRSVKAAPGKNALMAELLFEVAARPLLASRWLHMAYILDLFTGDLRKRPAKAAKEGQAQTATAAHAVAVNATVSGQLLCSEAGVQPCRCDVILGDTWDSAMIWAGRELGYDSLFMHATLLTDQCPKPPWALGGKDKLEIMAAYPEICDLRLPNAEWTAREHELVYPYLQPGNDQPIFRPKTEHAAEEWLRSLAEERRFTLRDGLDVSRQDSVRACNVSLGTGFTLRCDGHAPASMLPASRGWDRCARTMCGDADVLANPWWKEPKSRYAKSLTPVRTA